jgi:hypothetical protein
LTDGPLLKHIPKAARFTCATHLTDLLLKVVGNPTDTAAWREFCPGSRRFFGQPKSGRRHNSTAVVTKRVALYDSDLLHDQFIVNDDKLKSNRLISLRLAEAVAAKFEDGSIRAAVRLLMSDDKPADTSTETLIKLLEKHPSAPEGDSFRSARHLLLQFLLSSARYCELFVRSRWVHLVDQTAFDLNT